MLQGPASVWLLAYRARGTRLLTAYDDVLLELATRLTEVVAKAPDKFHVLHVGFCVHPLAAGTSMVRARAPATNRQKNARC